MSKDINWENLGFSYLQADCHIEYTWKDGQWDNGVLVESPILNLHIATTALHYGQSAFEGLKAFKCKDNEIRIFRPEANAKRLQTSSQRILMPEVPTELFLSALDRVVSANAEYVPPYGTGGSLYIRPLLFGSGPTIGLGPSTEYKFIILVTPVGPYYKGGLTGVDALIQEEFDRTAPRGMGDVKVSGNYAAGLYGSKDAKDKGYAVALHLDSKEHRYIDEFSTSNFIAITKDQKYVTPKSRTILPSITNDSLRTLARDMGITVEERAVEYAELTSFAEVGACGTAVILTPVNKIVRGNEVFTFQSCTDDHSILLKLYNELQGIQYGELTDKHNWMHQVPC